MRTTSPSLKLAVQTFTCGFVGLLMVSSYAFALASDSPEDRQIKAMAEREGFYYAIFAICLCSLHFRDNTLTLSGLQATSILGYSFYSCSYLL